MTSDLPDESDLPDHFSPKERTKYRQSVHFRIDDLPHVDHSGFSRPGALGTGFSVQTTGGDRLSLDPLFQCHTGAGQLAGFPLMDESKFTGAINHARSIFPHHDAPPFVIPPVLHRGRARTLRDGVESFEEWRVLPPVTCFGLFTASRPARGADDPYSSVLLIWFQDNWGLPDDPRTLRLIADLDWDSYAHSWNW